MNRGTVCGNGRCKYLKGKFCGLEFATLNQWGQCSIWNNDNGGIRVNNINGRIEHAPLYPADEKIEVSSENLKSS